MSHEADSGWGSIDAGKDRPVLRSDREFDTILARDALSRRALLARAAGLGVATVGLPAFLARGAAAKDLLVRATPRRGGTLVFAWIYPPVPQMDPQLPTNAKANNTSSEKDETCIAVLWVSAHFFADEIGETLAGRVRREPDEERRQQKE